jgi:hypothetical protein
MRLRITWKGKEVHHPVKRVLVACFVIPLALFGALLGIIGALISLVIKLVLTVLGVVLFPVFRIFGRKGIIRRSGKVIKIKLDATAFERK